MWQSDDTAFFTVFTHSKVYGLKVFTFSFRHDSHVDEKIVKIDGNKVITNVINPNTGYATGTIYKLLNDNTLMANFTGDNTEVKKTIYYKMNFTNEEGKKIDY